MMEDIKNLVRQSENFKMHIIHHVYLNISKIYR